jgi:Protein of unknown function (DUF3431)
MSVGKEKPKTAKKIVAAKKASVAKKHAVAHKAITTRPISVNTTSKQRSSDASKRVQTGTGIFSSLFSSNIRDLPISTPRPVEVVIARYNEPNIEILFSRIPKEFKITIYNKGPKETLVIPKHEAARIRVIDLPNIGRETNTYLHHIISNYNSGLADVTIFILASALDDSVYPKSHKFQAVIDAVLKSYTSAFPVTNPVSLKDVYNFSIETYTSTNKGNKTSNPQHKVQLCPIRPFGKWYTEVFKGLKMPKKIPITYNGIFAADIKHIKQRPLKLYEKLISFVNLPTHTNPEAGHYLERSWPSIFYPYPKYCLRKY